MVLKNLSSSKIPKSGSHIRSIFKIIDDAFVRQRVEPQITHKQKIPKSTLLILDYPSYLEKNFTHFGYYVIPVYPMTVLMESARKRF